MTLESTLFLAVWEMVEDHLPAAERTDAAMHLLRAFVDFGMEASDLDDAIDEDDTIRRAYELMIEDDTDDCFDRDDDDE